MSNIFPVYSDDRPTSQMLFTGKSACENELALHTNYNGQDPKDNDGW